MVRIKIAICGDKNTEANISFMVQEILERDGYELLCKSYSDIQEALRAIEIEKFDIYILNVNNSNWINIGKTIREVQVDAIIIFLGKNYSYINEAFDLRIFNYILEKEKNIKLKEVLKKCLNYLESEKKIYCFKKGKTTITINYDDIYYFESIKRKMKIVTQEDEFIYYDTFKSIENKIDNKKFVRVHLSFLVNMQHILKVTGKNILLTNNDIVPVGRFYLPMFNKKYMNYLNNIM